MCERGDVGVMRWQETADLCVLVGQWGEQGELGWKADTTLMLLLCRRGTSSQTMESHPLVIDEESPHDNITDK